MKYLIIAFTLFFLQSALGDGSNKGGLNQSASDLVGSDPDFSLPGSADLKNPTLENKAKSTALKDYPHFWSDLTGSAPDFSLPGSSDLKGLTFEDNTISSLSKEQSYCRYIPSFLCYYYDLSSTVKGNVYLPERIIRQNVDLISFANNFTIEKGAAVLQDALNKCNEYWRVKESKSIIGPDSYLYKFHDCILSAYLSVFGFSWVEDDPKNYFAILDAQKTESELIYFLAAFLKFLEKAYDTHLYVEFKKEINNNLADINYNIDDKFYDLYKEIFISPSNESNVNDSQLDSNNLLITNDEQYVNLIDPSIHHRERLNYYFKHPIRKTEIYKSLDVYQKLLLETSLLNLVIAVVEPEVDEYVKADQIWGHHHFIYNRFGAGYILFLDKVALALGVSDDSYNKWLCGLQKTKHEETGGPLYDDQISTLSKKFGIDQIRFFLLDRPARSALIFQHYAEIKYMYDMNQELMKKNDHISLETRQSLGNIYKKTMKDIELNLKNEGFKSKVNEDEKKYIDNLSLSKKNYELKYECLINRAGIDLTQTINRNATSRHLHIIRNTRNAQYADLDVQKYKDHSKELYTDDGFKKGLLTYNQIMQGNDLKETIDSKNLNSDKNVEIKKAIKTLAVIALMYFGAKEVKKLLDSSSSLAEVTTGSSNKKININNHGKSSFLPNAFKNSPSNSIVHKTWFKVGFFGF